MAALAAAIYALAAKQRITPLYPPEGLAIRASSPAMRRPEMRRQRRILQHAEADRSESARNGPYLDRDQW